MDRTIAKRGAEHPDEWMARAAALAPAIEAAGDRNERERRIAPEVISVLSDAGILHMLMPLALGGGAADIMAYNQVIETVAAADASTAWVLAQSLASSQAAGFLAPQIAREVFGSPNAIVAWGPSSGPAKAHVTDGGYTVTGRWRFASGSANATWMGGHSSVIEADGKPRLDAHGRPLMRTMLFRPSHAIVHDTWHVIGLRGTASNEYEVKELFVPEAYSTWRDYAPDRREPGPLYNIPLLTLYGIGFSGVGLGIARACLAAFVTLAETKKSGAGHGSQTVLRDNAVIQSKVAQATGQLASARAFLHEMLQEIWDASCTRGKLALEPRARLRIAIVGAIDQARSVVDFAYQAAGTTAIFQGSPFERRFRDMHTLLAQGQAHLANFEAAGLALMGVEPSQRL
jgi:alkylation response protein AidB-like acyl-CoA dehydrogenase